MAANQPRQAPAWVRLALRACPANGPAPTPAPEAPPSHPRPLLARPPFRQIGQTQRQPTQSQEPAPPQPPPPAASFETAPLPPAAGTASVPESPILRAPAASLPTSPAQTSLVLPPEGIPSTVPSPVKPSVPATTCSVSSSPALKLAAPTNSSVPSFPAQKAKVCTIAAPSPRIILQHAVQTPPQLPKPKPTAPLSPLTQPPSQIKSDADLEPKIPLEAEQKTVVFQKTIGKPNDLPWIKGTDSDRNFPETRKPSAAHIPRNEPFKEMAKKEAKVHGMKISSDSEEVGMRVITIAGENKGASMEIFRSPKKNVFEGSSYHRNRKENPSSRSSSDEEKNLKTKEKSHKGMPMNAPPMSAFMNSNVQGVNNSLVFQSSCILHDPGVHLSLSQMPEAGGFNVKDRGNGHQS